MLSSCGSSRYKKLKKGKRKTRAPKTRSGHVRPWKEVITLLATALMETETEATSLQLFRIKGCFFYIHLDNNKESTVGTSK
jgi:hypothetical protein